MPFVKLDTAILDSTLWLDVPAREVFITALLLAEPKELAQPMPQIAIGSLTETGFVVPAGWYGFVTAAGPGIVRRALINHQKGMDALERLGSPDQYGRSTEFEGRRLVRIDGGFVLLNYLKYRERDYSAADRQRRFRDRKRNARNTVTVTTVTHADADADVKKIKSKNTARARFQVPTLEQVLNYCILRRNQIDAAHFCDYYESKGWIVGKSQMRSWQAAVRTWEKNGFNQPATWRKSDGSIPNKAEQRAANNRSAIVEALFGKSVSPDGTIAGKGSDVGGNTAVGASASGTNRGGD